MTVKMDNVTREQYQTLLKGACRTVEDFMDYGTPSQMRTSYRKIKHIKVLRAMMDTDLRMAKEVVDQAFILWKNENPLNNDEALDALRAKLGVSHLTSDGLDIEPPF